MKTAAHDLLRGLSAGWRDGLASVLVIAVSAAAVAGTYLLAGNHARARQATPASAAVTEPRLRRTPTVGLRRVHFFSRALDREADYLVYLPSDYTPSRRLPVFYLLHGMPGRPLAFTAHADIEPKLERLIAEHRVRPMILVFPDGRIDGRTSADSEWANTPSGQFQSYVVNVVHDVDQRFAALPYRQDRAIAGLSAGAYGAANVGLHQLALFGLIQVWSGYFTQAHDGVFAHATPAQMAYDSPIDYVRTMRQALRRYPLRAFLYVGRHDGLHRQTAPMARALKAEGADVHYAMYPGGHSWQLWGPHTDQMLIMAGRDFEHPLA